MNALLADPWTKFAIIVAIKSGVLIFIVITSFAYLMLFERKILAWFQMRLGPIWCGPWGLLQPAADAVKLVLKEDLTPADADPLLYRFAPAIGVLTAVLAYAVIPFGTFPDGSPIAIADLNVAGAVGLAKFGGIDISYAKNVSAWLERCFARPARN